MDLLRDVGAVAGLAAFFGLAVLALLYFAQARDVRRLRENAEFLVEGEPARPGEGAERAPTAVTAPADPEAAARTAAASAPTEAEAFRRAELARQAAERRQRFEERRREEEGDLGGRVSNIPSAAVIAVGAIILIAGIAFGANRILGGDDNEPAGTGQKQAASAACPSGTQIAVLNGTAEAGLAGTFSKQLKDRSYETGKVTNTETGFDTSTVMFDSGGEACAREVGQLLQIQSTEPMDQEVRSIAEGAQVAVVLGEDKATGASTSAGTGATSGTLGD
ncbi:MAG TPA: LytR C-terminal domain-containing protein [Solirubrobacterales bacterium]|nr:LytR C-terminal domain-containing protein [Solirubrobacterales bacterium]